MHASHAAFLHAIEGKRRLSVRFFSRKAQKELVRICAPLDFGPLRGATQAVDHYQLWNLEGGPKPYNLALLDADILEMTELDETFDPATIITWTFKPHGWAVPRDWAEFS